MKSQWVAHTPLFACLVKKNHAYFHHSGGCQGNKTRLFISIITLPQKNTPSSPSWLPVTSGWRLIVYDNMAGGSLNSWKVWNATVCHCSIWSNKNCLRLRANKLTLILFVHELKLHLWFLGWYIWLKGIKILQLVVSTGTFSEKSNLVMLVTKLKNKTKPQHRLPKNCQRENQ